MTLHTYDFRSPSQLIEQVGARVPLLDNTAYVVLVVRPSTDPKNVTIRRLDTLVLIDDWQDARDEIYEVMQELPIPERPERIDHSVITVLVRHGLCVFGPNEGTWMSAWQYSRREVPGSSLDQPRSRWRSPLARWARRSTAARTAASEPTTRTFSLALVTAV
jgi:hypothetical protein